jgi:hypothetical protein
MTSVTILECMSPTSTFSSNDFNNLSKQELADVVMDFSIDMESRMNALELYCEQNGDNSVDLFSNFTGMYQFSGISILQEFLYRICTHGQMSPFLRLEAAQSLLSYEEDEFYEDNDEEIENAEAVQRNKDRLDLGYKALDHVCYDLKDPTPRRIDAIFTLMRSVEHKIVANSYFREMVNDQRIECDFRYKTILALENKELIIDKEFFIEKACLEFLFYKDNKTLYRILAAQKLMQMGRLASNKSEQVCTTILSFARNKELEYNLRADAADMLLGVAPDDIKKEARKIINELAKAFGRVKTVFDNAQNVHTAEIDKSLLEGLKELAKINLLEINGQHITFEFVRDEILKMVKVNSVENNKVVEVDVNQDINVDVNQDNCCQICGIYVSSLNTEDNTCSVACQENWKCVVSLNRIGMDRFRYSSFNFTLSHILLRVWSFIDCNEYKSTLQRRLIEELCDMCGTCSTGFAARLINVMSGFGEFNMQVSWGDQITANFIGRLNAFARRITEPNSIFRTEKLDRVIELYLNQHPEIKESLKCYQEYEKSRQDKVIDQSDRIADANREKEKELKRLRDTKEMSNAELKLLSLKPAEVVSNHDNNISNLQSTNDMMKNMVAEFKSNDKSIDMCIEEFTENVVNEMTLEASDWAGRQHFLLFFGSVMLRIREEMYEEFRVHISDDVFDNAIRDAISSYEGISNNH